MAAMIVRTVKLTDDEILKLLGEIFDLLPEASATISLPLGSNRRIAGADELAKYEYDRSCKSIQSLSVQLGQHIHETIVFQRGVVDPDHWRQHPNVGGFGRRQPSAHYDEIGFFPANHHTAESRPLGDDSKIRIAELLNTLAAPTDAASDEDARTFAGRIEAGR